MSADSPRRHPSGVVGSGIGLGSGSGTGLGSGSAGGSKSGAAVPAIVPPQTVSDRSILDSAIGFINDVTLANQPVQDPKDTITWARFETCADVSDPRFGDDWELEGNAAPPLLLILGYGLGVQVWAIPANGEAVEVLSWRHGVVTALRVLPTPATAVALDENGRADEPVDAFAEKRPLVAFVDGGSAAASGLLAGSSGLGLGGGSGGVTTVGGSVGGVGGIGMSAAAQFSAVNFMSLKTGVQVKTIKFKNAVLDIQANRSAVVITFHERIAVFDARTLEDRLTITTCYPSPGINPNPIALGPRWLAYAEHKLLHSKRSGGGCDGEGVPSYTATVLNAAKSLSKGLREFGEQVAAGLTGTTAGSGASSKSSSFDSASGGPDAKQSGVVTIIDVKHPVKDYSPTSGTPLSSTAGSQGGGDPIVAHFVAHSEALVAMEFDSSGMLLLTADRRGHDFHVFRVQPHPVGPSLAAVHHLYVLHRGDTSAKVQHIAFSLDSRWAAVSTLRGTTHVFPITPYGGAMGVRTHTSLHVVNKLSRFHRSAGLGADGRSSSPISHSESTTFVQSLQPYHNPTLPPYPRPSVVQPLAQLRQPFTLGSPPGSAGLGGGVGGGGVMGSGVSSGGHGVGVGVGSNSQRQRQRLSSLSDDSGKPLSVCSIFAKSRSWLLEPPMATREQPHRVQRKAVDSLFVMAGHGALIQYDLDTKLASHVAKEKICDDTPIELEVEARAQWNLGRRKDGSQEIAPPLGLDNWLIKDRHASLLLDSAHQFDDQDERTESWLAQVEIITHAGPHRRLWMGPQFVFKNYNTPSGSNLNHVDAEAVEIGVTKTTTTTLPSTAASSALGLGTVGGKDRSSPLNMPLSAATSVGGAGIGSSAVTGRSGAGVPVLIESGSYSSIEQSPKLMDRFRHGHLDSDYGHGDTRLKEDLADAMRESPSTAAARRETTAATVDQAAPPCGDHLATGASPASADLLAAGAGGSASSNCDNACYYDALAEHESLNDLDEVVEDQHPDAETHLHSMDSISALASVLPNICSYSRVEKMVNPLGTVTDLNAGISGELQTDMLDEVVGQLAAEDTVIHENCDEALFRPVVAIFCSDPAERQKLLQKDQQTEEATASELEREQASCQPPVVLVNKLVVPVIAKEVDEVLVQKEKQKSQKQSHKAQQQQQQQQQQQKTLRSLAAAEDAAQAQKFAELSNLNKPKGNSNNNKTASQKSGSGTSEDEATTTITLAKSAKKAKNNKQKTSAKVSEKKPEQTNLDEKKVSVEKEENEERALPVVKETTNKEDSDAESDHADSLLANKSSIAAVMVSSASAQGLSLHVEMSAPDAEQDEDEEIEELEEEPPKTISKDNKKKQKPGDAVATMTIDKEKEKAKEKELKLKEKEREAKLQEKEKEERLKQKEREENLRMEREEKLKEEKIKEKEREEKLKEEKIKEKQREEKLKEEKLKEKEREERIKEKEREEKAKEKQREEKLREEKIKEKEREEKLKEKLRVEKENEKEEKLRKEREEKMKEKEREEKNKERERAEKIKEKEREEKLKKEKEEKLKEKEELLKKKEKEEKEREEKLKEKERQEKLKEKEREEKLKKETEERQREKEREEKLKEKERAEKLKDLEKEAKLKEKEEQLKEKEKEVKLKEKKEKDKVKEKEKSLESEKLLISATVSNPWRRVVEDAPPKLPAVQDYPSLGKKPTKASPETKRDEKLLPGLTTPPKEVNDTFEDFLSGLKPLEALPPLPALEPLEVKEDSKKETVSLINFESPLQETASIPRKISPPPRGFTEQNLILALCGSLHYENEQERIRETEAEVQPEVVTTPEPVYITLDTMVLQKSTSTSNNSSGSEEIVVMEEPVKKLSKKHKRLKQLQLQQQQQQREREPDDEELRPLISISMCDSQLDVPDIPVRAMPDDDEGVEEEPETEPEQSLPEDLLHFGSSGVATNATTTDSEGPVPATTSDDNVVYGSSSTTNAAPHKLKTKKLEHKINLIAAIEAATSSSTSSAEESSVETTVHPDPTGLGLGIGLQSHSPGAAVGAGSSTTGAATTASLPAAGGVTSVGLAVGVASPPSATKKKTKRRKR
ncbi:microtubule-associated protein futsch isoform X1 [Drosophila simulans]|uniref:microtubule-associated protein futsch isoform X1 n=1 Tax=Drosophila simulans TaxID=7240 RepID=UPI00192D0E13|nr:microtubule-associated protein futsch isoform X1 [Drosophila simulans]